MQKLGRFIKSHIPLTFACGVLLGLIVTFAARTRPGICVAQLPSPSGSQCLKLEKAESRKARERGLSRRSNLPQNQGMLFVFDRTGRHCMWMKDTRFNLDMVWLDATGKITQISRNVAPDTYPQSFCGPGQYVIEVNAGVADLAGFVLGTTVQL